MPRIYITTPPEQRFWKYVKKTPTCWLWTGAKHYPGYGVILRKKGKYIDAHRFSYELHNGEIPAGKWVLHRCDNPACVNPEHLFIGNNSDNIKDAYEKGICKRGEQNKRSKLTNEQVLWIRSNYIPGNGKKMAKELGISQTAVSLIIRRINWKHI
jgi:hypothetical protein